MQYAGKVSGRTQSSVVDVHFGFTKSVDIPGRLVEDRDLRCRRCVGNAQAILYLGDCICPGGGCELATLKRCCFAWGKFREFLLYV